LVVRGCIVGVELSDCGCCWDVHLYKKFNYSER
jgi:hypothetical protein